MKIRNLIAAAIIGTSLLTGAAFASAQSSEQSLINFPLKADHQEYTWTGSIYQGLDGVYLVENISIYGREIRQNAAQQMMRSGQSAGMERHYFYFVPADDSKLNLHLNQIIGVTGTLDLVVEGESIIGAPLTMPVLYNATVYGY